MSTNLVDLLKSQVGSQIAAQVSRQFGMNEQSAKSGVDAILPTILGGLLKQVTSPGGAEKLDRTMKDGGYDGGLLDNLTDVFGGAKSTEVQQKGGDLLTMLFGDKVAMVGPILSKLTGIKLDSFSSILATLAPLVLSFLAKQKQAMGLDAQGLSSLIVGQKDNIIAAMPPGVPQAMGLGGFELPGVNIPGVSLPGTGTAPAGGGAKPASQGIPTGVALGIIAVILLVVGFGVYQYIFSGIRPSGPAGNTITELPEDFDYGAAARQAAAMGNGQAPASAPAGTDAPAAADAEAPAEEATGSTTAPSADQPAAETPATDETATEEPASKEPASAQ